MKIESAGENTWKFWCPGCDEAHVVSDSWEVDAAAGTIHPSVLVYSRGKFVDPDLTGVALMAASNIVLTPRCHSFVTDGRIHYLTDSTHALAGQIVDVPDWCPAWDERESY